MVAKDEETGISLRFIKHYHVATDREWPVDSNELMIRMFGWWRLTAWLFEGKHLCGTER